MVRRSRRVREACMERTASDRENIRRQNDEMRALGPSEAGANRWILTQGIVSLGPAAVQAVIEKVQRFDAFDGDNDPYGEHDFGAFDAEGQRLFWKIDYYNLTLDGGSPHPTDSAVTVRVLTILLASEY